MNKSQRSLFPVLAALLLASLACTCGAIGLTADNPTAPPLLAAPTEDTSGLNASPTDTAEPLEAPTQPEGAPTKPPIGGGDLTASPFPMPDDAANVVNAGGTVNYQTGKSLNEMIAFYQAAFAKQGLTERTLLHVESESTFSIVFDGDPSGKATVVQGVDLGGSSNINVRLEAIP